MRITTADLREACQRLLAHVEDVAGNAVVVEKDFYWDIPRDARFDVHREPEKFTVGQLSDDWNELQRIATGKAEPVAYALVWLSSIIRAIGEQVVG
jgi:hypothetical protein